MVYLELIRHILDMLYASSSTSTHSFVAHPWQYVAIAKGTQKPNGTHELAVSQHLELTNFRFAWSATKHNKSPIIFLVTEGLVVTLLGSVVEKLPNEQGCNE